MQSLRLAFRRLSKSKSQSLLAVFLIALGIALATAVFAIAFGLRFRGLPFPQQDRLMQLRPIGAGHKAGELDVFFQDFVALRSGASTPKSASAGIAAFRQQTLNLSGAAAGSDEKPERVQGAVVSGNFFEVLGVRGVQPLPGAGGRLLVAADDAPNAPLVMVVSSYLWKSRFGSDPKIAGRAVRVNGEDAVIVGVAPDEMDFPFQIQAWVPLRWDVAAIAPGDPATRVEIFARLKDGASAQALQAEFSTIAAAHAQDVRDQEKVAANAIRPRPLVFRVLEGPGEGGEAFTMLLIAVLLVLAIACMNVSSLALARVAPRAGEIGIRAALGAGRFAVVREVLAESWVIAALGGVLGIGLAAAICKIYLSAISTFGPQGVFGPRLGPVEIGFALALTVVAALLSGLAPAWRAARLPAVSLLRAGGPSLKPGRLEALVVVGEVAFACILLILCGLTARAASRLGGLDLGLDLDRVMTFRTALFERSYPTPASRVAFAERFLERISTAPGVTAAAAVTALPFQGPGPQKVAIEGTAYDKPDKLPSARVQAASPGSFRALGVALLAGRDFSAADRSEGEAVVIVNQSFAKRHWPRESPLGRRVRVGRAEENGPWRRVIGVAPDLQMNGAFDPARPHGLYVPLAQTDKTERLDFILRTEGNPAALTKMARTEVAALDPDLPLYNTFTLREVRNRNLLFFRVISVSFAVAGLASLLLGALGVFAVAQAAAAARRREVGIRMAIGADRRDIVRHLLKRSVRPLVIALLLGLPLAWMAGQGLGSALYDIRASDPLVFVGVPLVLAAATLLAALGPARRAGRTEPADVLRTS